MIQEPEPGKYVDELSSKDVQGEAGDWYEVSRYGAFTSPALGVFTLRL